MEKCGVKEFLKRKNVTITVQTYLIDALGAMAFGLFASLLIGTIFGTLGQQFNLAIFIVIADYAKAATGAALALPLPMPFTPLPGPFFRSNRRYCRQCSRGTCGRSCRNSGCSRAWEDRFKGNPAGHSGHPWSDHHFRSPRGTVHRTRRSRLYELVWRPCENSYRITAIVYGNPGIRPHRHRPDPAHQQRCHLHRLIP